jgi:4-alpha-glucanotransferase
VNLTFQLRFCTKFGESLWLTGNHEIFGGGALEKAIPLHYASGDYWQVTLALQPGAVPNEPLSYSYFLRRGDDIIARDWGNGRVINPAAFSSEDVLVIDSWNFSGFYENAFLTEPFQQVLLRPNHTDFRIASPPRVTHTFKVRAPLLSKDQTLCLLGGAGALGNWNTAAPLLLSRIAGQDFLVGQFDLSQEQFPIAYKYGVYDLDRRAFIRYEDGGNRILHDTVASNKQTVVNDGFAVLPSTTWKGAGIAIPVFSLRGENGFGVGEFTDLKPLVDWCQQTGLKLIQLLPINDTSATHTWSDSYPYAAISAFALHPLYLNLSRVVTPANQHLLEKLEDQRNRLNTLPAVDYEAVMNAKLAFIKQIYPSQQHATFKSKNYRRFFEQNKIWLLPYATFCCLRDKHGTADFNQWPESERRFQDAEKGRLAASDDVALHYFIQYHLHCQLKEAAEYAHANGVILKGDLAIGVSCHSAETWRQPELFHLDVQAGAPPDAFAAKGQNWGFPTYNWECMKETGYEWWKRRFEQMALYFDAFRIDHILGFFRIWSIPLNAVEGILGFFAPALPLHVGEFARRGIPFDYQRYVEPYITDHVLLELFGTDHVAVRNRFLNFTAPGAYTLKPEFATQRQVERHFDGVDQNESNHRLKAGLFDLISNVLLFEVEGSRRQQFHFRIGMLETSSFKHLDAHRQGQFQEMYFDYFYHRQDAFWMSEAMRKLPALKRATNMLICGEDLGMVPACVPEVMRELGLLSLEIQRMPKSPSQEFSRPKDAPYLSVVTPSTHDMSTIRGWWREDRNLTQKFYNQELGLTGVAPEQCEPWINKAVVLQHLSSPAMWSIFQLQDLLGMDGGLRRENPDDERINLPANPKHYWKYRMHLTLETLLSAETFNSELNAMVRQNGR